MTIDKAIEVKTARKPLNSLEAIKEFEEADMLSIEALRVVNRYSFTQRAWEGRLLPGETKD